MFPLANTEGPLRIQQIFFRRIQQEREIKNEFGWCLFSSILKLYQKSKTVRMTTIILQQEKALNYLKI